jgi:hypothetical protein
VGDLPTLPAFVRAVLASTRESCFDSLFPGVENYG